MGYGGTGYATVNVDIAQTDVDAIVQGITGYYGRTLTDVDNDLGNYLYNGNSAADYLSWIASSTNDLDSYLGGWNYGVLNNGTYAVDYLNWIYYSASNIESYLGGGYGGPLTNIDGNTSWTANNTSAIADYLYDYNTSESAASLLADIRNLLQQFSFDGTGRLRVNTTA